MKGKYKFDKNTICTDSTNIRVYDNWIEVMKIVEAICYFGDLTQKS